MADLKETLTSTVGEARTVFAVDSPIINFILAVLVAYVVLYFITFVIGPVLFGMRPYPYGWPHFIARTMHHVTRRALDMNDDSAAELTAKVTSSITGTGTD